MPEAQKVACQFMAKRTHTHTQTGSQTAKNSSARAICQMSVAVTSQDATLITIASGRRALKSYAQKEKNALDERKQKRA